MLQRSRIHVYNALACLKEERRQAIADHIDEVLPDLVSQDVEWGLLDIPPYTAQTTERSCVAASFNMVIRGITYAEINNSAFSKAAYRVFRSEAVREEEFLKLMQTTTFSNRFESAISSISFAGFDLQTVSRLAGNIRAKISDVNIFCVVSVLSNTSREINKEGIWHSNVLLGTDGDYVIVHQPSTKGDFSEREVSKEDFIHRWAQAYGMGHLIIGRH